MLSMLTVTNKTTIELPALQVISPKAKTINYYGARGQIIPGTDRVSSSAVSRKCHKMSLNKRILHLNSTDKFHGPRTVLLQVLKQRYRTNC